MVSGRVGSKRRSFALRTLCMSGAAFGMVAVVLSVSLPNEPARAAAQDAVLGERDALTAVLAAYPWSGHQFLDPGIGTTRLHVVMGDRDDWCSVQQVQGHVHAIRLSGGAVTMR